MSCILVRNINDSPRFLISTFKKYPYLYALVAAIITVMTLYILERSSIWRGDSLKKGWAYGGPFIPFALIVLYMCCKRVGRKNPPISEPTSEKLNSTPDVLIMTGPIEIEVVDETSASISEPLLVSEQAKIDQQRDNLQNLIETNDFERVSNFVNSLDAKDKEALFRHENESGETILYECSADNIVTTEIFNFLVEVGGVIGGSSKDKKDLLYSQMSTALPKFPALYKAIKRELTSEELKKIVSEWDIFGHTLLHHAVKCQVEESILVQIIKDGACISIDYKGKSFLHYLAASSKMAPMLPAILSALGKDAVTYNLHMHFKDGAGETPMTYAFNTGVDCQIAVIDPLLKMGVKMDPSGKKRKDFTPLHYAIYLNEPIEAFRSLLQGKSKEELAQFVNAQDSLGFTALHYAANQRIPLEIVELLLSSGADVEIQSTKGYTCIHSALFAQDYNMLPFLLKSVKDPKKREALLKLRAQQEGTALTFMVTKKKCLRFIPTLIQSGADVEELNSGGFSPLLCAICTHASQEEVRKILEGLEESERIRLLNEIEPLMGYTLLHIAVLCRVPSDILALLISYGAKDHQDNEGYTSLFYVDPHQVDSLAIYKVLLDPLEPSAKSKLLNLQDKAGETLLFRLIKNKAKTTLIQYCLESGSSTEIFSKENLYPIHFGVLHPEAKEVCKLLLSGVPKEVQKKVLHSLPPSYMTLLQSTLYLGNLELSQLILEGLSVDECRELANITFSEGDTLLHRMTLNQYPVESIRFLIKLGAKVDQVREKADDDTNRLCTPMHNAANTFGTSKETWVTLLEPLSKEDRKRALNMPNGKGETVLHWVNGQPRHVDSEIVQFLLEEGALPNIQDCNGNTPLHVAKEKGRPELMALLLQHGADPTICNHNNEQALENPKEILERGREREILWSYFSYQQDSSGRMRECRYENVKIEEKGVFCVLQAEEDHNSAFFIYPGQINHNLARMIDMSESHRTTCFNVVDSEERMFSTLEKIEDGTISRLLVEGHGYCIGNSVPTILGLGKVASITAGNAKLVAILEKKLNPNGSIVIFHSCSFGAEKAEGVIGLCHEVSRIKNVTVYTSADTFSGFNVRYFPGEEVDTRFFAEDKKTDLTVRYKKGLRQRLSEAPSNAS